MFFINAATTTKRMNLPTLSNFMENFYMTFLRRFSAFSPRIPSICLVLVSVFLLVWGNASAIAMGAPKAKQQEGGEAKIKQLKKLKLIEKLDLDDATAEKFFVRYNGGQKKVEEARKALDEATNELDKAKASGNNDKIKQVTESMLQKHKNLQDVTNEMLKSIRGVLTEKQYAEFLVFEAKFPEILRKSLQERKDSTRK
ncbi:MAG: hypothetical protein EAZ92_05655 [Candidatus Kapaibacterium sp.]|nr:MAG: hypothetical protein EAZ92_05655 [Candidatus Kapabacteria bacterium]